jgi:hypothetical protein
LLSFSPQLAHAFALKGFCHNIRGRIQRLDNASLMTDLFAGGLTHRSIGSHRSPLNPTIHLVVLIVAQVVEGIRYCIERSGMVLICYKRLHPDPVSKDFMETEWGFGEADIPQ